MEEQGAKPQQVAGTPPESERLRICAVPGWVDHEPYETSSADIDRFVANGVCLLISDRQQDLTGARPAHHMRVAHRVMTATGASSVAQFAVSFDPLLQDLEIHWVRVIRDGAVIDHASPAAFQIMRREQNMERQVLDGRLTATLVMPDVRTGDIVERCWTVYGGSPVLREAFGDWIALDGGAALSIRYRLHTPKSRPVATRSYGDLPAPTMTERDGVADWRWRNDAVNRLRFEDYTPPWRQLSPSLQVSECASWSAVSRLFAPHYTDESYPEFLHDEAAAICTAHDDPGDRLIAALASVQKRIRYLSLSIGDGSFLPRPLSGIWTSGYGDCKDSSRLLSALARLCGLDAAPALVATNFGPVLDQWLPSANVFDHCIVRVRLNDVAYWIDPTRRYQPQKIDLLWNSYSGWALPLTEPGEELQEIPPQPPRPFTETEEKVEFGTKVDSPATLAVNLKLFAAHAESVRAQIADQGISEMADRMLRRYQKEWPKIAVKTPLAVQEFEQDGSIALTAEYTIEKPWRDVGNGRVGCEIVDHDVSGQLGPLARDAARTSEIYLGIPRIMKRRTEILLPSDWQLASVAVHKEMAGARFVKNNFKTAFRRYTVEQSLTISTPAAPASEAIAYSDLVQACNASAVLTLSTPVERGKFKGAPKKLGSWIWFAWIAVVVLMQMLAHCSDISPPANEQTGSVTIPPAADASLDVKPVDLGTRDPAWTKKDAPPPLLKNPLNPAKDSSGH